MATRLLMGTFMIPSSVEGSCHNPDVRFLAGAVSADELASWLAPVDVGQMTFILASCYSAQSVEGNSFKPAPMDNRGLGQLAYDKRMRILAASQSDSAAQEDISLKMGVLTTPLPN